MIINNNTLIHKYLVPLILNIDFDGCENNSNIKATIGKLMTIAKDTMNKEEEPGNTRDVKIDGLKGAILLDKKDSKTDEPKKEVKSKKESDQSDENENESSDNSSDNTTKKLNIEKKIIKMSETKPNYPQITDYTVYKLCIKTTKKINKRQDKLKSIKWKNGESNLDTEYSKLACECCELAWDEMKIKYPKYSEIEIICKIPDINITFIYPNGKETKHKIELKSSKRKKIHGSTIKDLDINQMLIYCLRPSIASDPYIVRCSQYHNAMSKSDIDLFQDRTPRPLINFEKMNDVDNIVPLITKDKYNWKEHYAKCSLKRIEEHTMCQKSWQDDMIKIVKQESIKAFFDDYLRNTSEEQFQIDKLSLQVENTNI